MKEQKTIDIARLLLSLMVIAIHCGISDYSVTVFNIFQDLVPCFFVISGYLIEVKSGGGIFNFIKKVIRMYLWWLLIYAPLTFYYMLINGNPFYEEILDLIRDIVIVGGTDAAGMLWYVLALFYGCIITNVVVYKLGLGIKNLVIVVGFVLALGYLITYYVDNNPNTILTKLFFVFVGTTRNGIFQGFTFLSIGILIKRMDVPELINTSLRRLLAIILIILIIPIACNFSTTRSLFMAPLLCMLIVSLLLSFNMSVPFSTKPVRAVANWIFFVHMYIYFVFIELLAQKSLCGIFIGVAVCSTLLSMCLYKLSFRYNFLNQLI